MLSRRRALVVGAVIGAAGLGVGWMWGAWLVDCLRALWAMYGSPEGARGLVARFGIWAPVIFVGLQALQVVLSPIPGEATGVLGGYLFGAWLGLLYSMLGLTLGSALAFALSRWLGLRLIRRVIPAGTYEKVASVGKLQGVVVTFLLFLIPGFPKDYLSYLLGLTPMSWRNFLLASTLGRLPGTWLLSVQGGVAGSGRYGVLLGLLALCIGLALVSYLYRATIRRWIQRRSAPPLSDSPQC